LSKSHLFNAAGGEEDTSTEKSNGQIGEPSKSGTHRMSRQYGTLRQITAVEERRGGRLRT